MRKRFLAMLLSVAMVLTMLPVAAFAADDPAGLAGLKITLENKDSNKTISVTESNGDAISAGKIYYKLETAIPTATPEASDITNASNGYAELTDEVTTNTGVDVTGKNYVYAGVVAKVENVDTLTHWGVQAIEPATVNSDNAITAKLKADDTLAVTFAGTAPTGTVSYASQEEAFITPAKSDSAYTSDTNKWVSDASTLSNVKVNDYVAAAVFDGNSSEFTYWSTAQVEAGYITVNVADSDANVKIVSDSNQEVETLNVDPVETAGNDQGSVSFNVKLTDNYDLVVNDGTNDIEGDANITVTPVDNQTHTHTVKVTAAGLGSAKALTISAKAQDVVVVKSIDNTTISAVKDDEGNAVTAGGAVEPTLDGTSATVPLTVTTTDVTTIPTVTLDPSGAIDGATVEPTETEKEWTVTVPYTGTGFMNIKLATSTTIPDADGLTVKAVPKANDETKLTLTITDPDESDVASNIANYVIKTVTDDSTPSVALGADVSTGYTTLSALEIDAKSGGAAITKVLVVKKNSGGRAIKAGVGTVGAEETENVELTLTLTRDAKNSVKVAAVDNTDSANPVTIAGFKAAISETKLAESNLDTLKDSISTVYTDAGLTTDVAGKKNVNVIKEDGGKLYWGTAEIPVWVEATAVENSGITVKDGSAFAYADNKKTITVTVTGTVVPAVLNDDGTANAAYTFTQVEETNDYTLTLDTAPTADLTLKIGAKPAGTTETKNVTLTWVSGITVTGSDNQPLTGTTTAGVTSASITVPAAGVSYTVATTETTKEVAVKNDPVDGVTLNGGELKITNAVTADTVELILKDKSSEENPTEISEVAVTLNTTGLKVGDPLPEAETTTAGVKLTTVWKDSTDKVVTTVEAADTTYTATITVSTDTGYTLAETVAYTLNEEEAEATNNVITTTVEVKDDTTPGDDNNVATGETEVVGGTATGSVDKTDVDKAITAATEDEKTEVVLDFTKDSDGEELTATAAAVTIPGAAVEAVNDAEGELELTVKTPVAFVTLTNDAVKDIAADAKPGAGETVSIVLTVEKPADDPAAGIPQAQAFEIKFEKIVTTGGVESAPTPVEVKKPVTLTLKTTVEPVKGSDTLIAYFVEGTNKTIVNANAPYDTVTKSAKFTVEHLSTYMLKATLAEDETLKTEDGTPFVDNKLEVEAGKSVSLPAGVKATALSMTAGLTYDGTKFVLADGVDSGTAKFTVGGVEYTYVVKADTSTTTPTGEVKQAALVGGAFKKLYVEGLDQGEVVVFVINTHSKFPKSALYLTAIANKDGEASVIVNNGVTGGVVWVYPANTTEVFDGGAPAAGCIATIEYKELPEV